MYIMKFLITYFRVNAQFKYWDLLQDMINIASSLPEPSRQPLISNGRLFWTAAHLHFLLEEDQSAWAIAYFLWFI